jgi:hypothetical protein
MKIRIVVAAAVLVSGLVHLKLWADGFRDTSVIGPLFLLNAVAGLVIAVGVLRWRSWPPLLVAVGFGASTLGAFAISASVGLFGVHEVWNGGAYAITANVSELVAVAAGSWALYVEGWAVKARKAMSHRQRQRPVRADHHAA